MGTISASRQTSSLQSILVTALKNGSVQMWNTSTPTLRLVHQVDAIIYSFNNFLSSVLQLLIFRSLVCCAMD